jgi:hypothetical protein
MKPAVDGRLASFMPFGDSFDPLSETRGYRRHVLGQACAHDGLNCFPTDIPLLQAFDP